MPVTVTVSPAGLKTVFDSVTEPLGVVGGGVTASCSVTEEVKLSSAVPSVYSGKYCAPAAVSVTALPLTVADLPSPATVTAAVPVAIATSLPV